MLPSLKVSTQALMLQIAAEQLWGPGNHAKLDHIIVALPHPEAAAAVFNPGHEINTHFATSPFHEAEMKAGLRTVTSGFDIMGDPRLASPLPRTTSSVPKTPRYSRR